MIECAEFDYDYENTHAFYLWCLHVATMTSLTINPVVIYSIIYHSSSQMNTYRWYLLVHQIAAFVADIWISFFGQAVIIAPLPGGYPLGYAKYFSNSRRIYAVGQATVVFEQMTVVLLFFYRYQTVHRAQTIPFKWKCFLLSIAVLMFGNIYLPLQLTDRTKEVFEQLSHIYSCITPRLRKIDGMEIMDKTEVMTYVIPVLIFDAIYFLSSVSYLAIGSWRATHTQNMSAQLRQMQQRFLIQLFFQSLIPMGIVVAPIMLIVGIIIFDVFGVPWLSDVFLSAISIFSIISAVTLFVTTPRYHRWFTKYFYNLKARLYIRSSVQSTVLNHNN